MDIDANGNTGSWEWRTTLGGSNLSASDKFGRASSIDGNIAVVAATHQEVDNVTDVGAVYVFYRNKGKAHMLVI